MKKETERESKVRKIFENEKYLRKRLKLKEEVVAAYLEIPVYELGLLESGVFKNIETTFLEKISALYCISAKDLIEKDTDYMENEIRKRGLDDLSEFKLIDMIALSNINRIYLNQKAMDEMLCENRKILIKIGDYFIRVDYNIIKDNNIETKHYREIEYSGFLDIIYETKDEEKLLSILKEKNIKPLEYPIRFYPSID